MSENIDEKTHQSELMKYALESVKDNDQAFQLLEGKITDAILVKAQVHVENRSGILIFPFSVFKGDILSVHSVFGNSPLIIRMRTYEKYPQFLLDTIEIVKSGGNDKALSERIARAVYKNISASSLMKTIPKVSKKNYEELIALVQNGVNLELKISTTKAVIDVEKVSSIQFRMGNPLDSVLQPVLNPYNVQKEEEEKKKTVIPVFETSPEKLKAEKEISEIQKEFQKVVICKTVVSPVAGLEFDALKETTKLLFLLPFQTEEEIEFAKQMGAVSKEGVNKPILGTFYKIITSGKNEFHIFAKGPNGILFRAFEERPVRLATPKQASKKKVETKADTSATLSIIIGVLVTLVAILLFLYIS
jgi:hypothetical protein